MENKENTVTPIIIGVSAHRNIRGDQDERIEIQVRKVITDLRGLCPHSPLCMLTGLAAGGDMFCARIAVDMGVKLILALPFDESDYVNPVDFPDGGEKEYAALRNSGAVEKCFVMPDTEKAAHDGNDRDYLFRQQSIYVATRSHLLLALWDGTDASNSASECGTNAAVGFALKGNYRNADRSADGAFAVIKIFAPREGRTYGETGENDLRIKYLTPTAHNSNGNRGANNSDGRYYDENNELPAPLRKKLIEIDDRNKRARR